MATGDGCTSASAFGASFPLVPLAPTNCSPISLVLVPLNVLGTKPFLRPCSAERMGTTSTVPTGGRVLQCDRLSKKVYLPGRSTHPSRRLKGDRHSRGHRHRIWNIDHRPEAPLSIRRQEPTTDRITRRHEPELVNIARREDRKFTRQKHQCRLRPDGARGPCLRARLEKLSDRRLAPLHRLVVRIPCAFFHAVLFFAPPSLPPLTPISSIKIMMSPV